MKLSSPQMSEKDSKKFSEMTSSLPELLELIPDDQDDSILQSAELTPLCNLDLRKDKSKRDDQGTLLSSTQLFVHHKKFKDLYKVGTFIYNVTEGVAGQTQLNEFIFVQPNPRKPFEKKISASPTVSSEVSLLAENDIDTFAIPYLMACLENTSPFGLKPNPIILVLGRQHEDGHHENLEIYQSYFASLTNKTGNISQYKMNDNAVRFGINPAMTIFHANMHGFQDQHLDSADLEKLYDIYSIAKESHRPLIIHCKDGMDRTGAVSVAYHLLHHWDRIFDSKDLLKIAKNIKAEHESLQQKRGPGFCVAQKSLLQGAVTLVFILRSIQMSRALCDEDVALRSLLNGKEYLQQYYILERMKSDSKHFSPAAEKLFAILKNRAHLESTYFDEFSLEIPHPAITLWNIDKMISNSIALGNESQELDFISRFTKLQHRYVESESLDAATENELSNLYYDIKIQSILTQIQAAIEFSPRNQDQQFLADTFKKTESIIASVELNNIKLNKLTGILLRLETLPRIQKIEKFLFEIKLPDEDREIKRSEFNGLKKTLETHLRAIESLGVDKRKLMKICLAKLESFEKTLEVPTNIGASSSSSRRRFLSNPPSLNDFKKFFSSSKSDPNPNRRPSEEDDTSTKHSPPPSKSGTTSPRRPKPGDTSPKLSRSTAKPTAVSSNGVVPSKSSKIFSSSPALPTLKKEGSRELRENKRQTHHQMTSSDDGKSPKTSGAIKRRTSMNFGAFKSASVSPTTSPTIIEEKSEDAYFI